jgi:hypothetical protein
MAEKFSRRGLLGALLGVLAGSLLPRRAKAAGPAPAPRSAAPTGFQGWETRAGGTTFTYDAAGRLTSTRDDWPANVVTFTYDLQGARSRAPTRRPPGPTPPERPDE